MDDMKEYVFERGMFANTFIEIIGLGTKEFNVLDDARYNFTSIGDFRIWTEEENIYILHLPSGILLGWYKFYHIGRCNFCNKSDMSESELKEFFQLLKEQLGNEPDSTVYHPNVSVTETDQSEYKPRPDIASTYPSKIMLNSTYGLSSSSEGEK